MSVNVTGLLAFAVEKKKNESDRGRKKGEAG